MVTIPIILFTRNLFGAANCLEYARQHGSDFVFLSTSRVYSIDALRKLPLDQNDSRLFSARRTSRNQA